MFKLTNIRKLYKAASRTSTSTTLVTCGYYILNIKVHFKTILEGLMTTYILVSSKFMFKWY